jgi:hypothetical protein
VTVVMVLCHILSTVTLVLMNIVTVVMVLCHILSTVTLVLMNIVESYLGRFSIEFLFIFGNAKMPGFS